MVVVKTKYTKKIFIDFANFFVKSSKSMKYIYVCSGIILGCAIAMLTLDESKTTGIIYLFLGVLFACYGLFMRFLLYFTNKKNIDTTDVFIFEDDKIIVNVHDKSGKEIVKNSMLYACMDSVKKYKNYGYIFLNKSVAYIVEKESFENEDQFNSVLKNIEDHIIKNKKSNIDPLIVGNANVTPVSDQDYVDLGEPNPPLIDNEEEAKILEEDTKSLLEEEKNNGEQADTVGQADKKLKTNLSKKSSKAKKLTQLEQNTPKEKQNNISKAKKETKKETNKDKTTKK